MTRRRVGPSLGVPTLMVTFVALSMAVFATLSLLSARLDYNLARRQAEASRAFYAADAAAEERLGDIHRALTQALETAHTADGFFTELSYAGILWDGFERRGNRATLTFSLPAGEARQLAVTCRVDYDAADHTARLTRTGWQLIATPTEPEPGEGLAVWAGPDADFQIKED